MLNKSVSSLAYNNWLCKLYIQYIIGLYSIVIFWFTRLWCFQLTMVPSISLPPSPLQDICWWLYDILAFYNILIPTRVDCPSDHQRLVNESQHTLGDEHISYVWLYFLFAVGSNEPKCFGVTDSFQLIVLWCQEGLSAFHPYCFFSHRGYSSGCFASGILVETREDSNHT